MKTYLDLFVYSEGNAPSEIKAQLLTLGFKATKGGYDFVFDWDKEDVSIEELINLTDSVHQSLKGHNVFFKIETI